MPSGFQLVDQDDSSGDTVKPLVHGQIALEEATNEHRNTDGSAAGSNSSRDLDEQPLLILDSLSSVLEHIKGSIILENNEYRLVTDPQEHDWQKLQAYAKTVKEVSISEDDDKAYKVADVLYYRLGQLQGTSPLFPSLRRLRITSKNSAISLPYLLLFFSPSLQEVELLGLTNIAQPTVMAFLQFTGTQAYLTTLVLNPINLTPQVVKLITRCSSLETLELLNMTEGWSESSFLTLALLPQLRRLRIDATKIVKTEDPNVNGPNKASSVRDLYFGGTASTLDVLVSGHINMPDLSILHLEITKHHDELDPVLNAFKHFSGSGNAEGGKKLTSLTITFSNENSLKRGKRDACLPFNYLAAFSVLHNLEYFEISGIQIEEMNRFPNDLGQHWPKIQTLRLPPTNHSCLSLTGMATLARFCPQLSHLQVSVEIPYALSAFPVVSKDDIRSHPLVILSVGSPANKTTTSTGNMRRLDSVARWLYATFPNLRQIGTCKAYQDEFWTDVGRLVKLCQAAVEFNDIRAATRPASLEG